MVDCRMLQGPLAGQIVSIAAEDAVQALADGWAEPVVGFTSYPWPWNVDRAEAATPPPQSFEEWEAAGSPPGAPHGEPQPLDPPTLSSISPTSAKAGTGPLELTLTGTKFTPMTKAFAQKDGLPDMELPTAFVSVTSATASIATDAATAGDYGIVVKQGENVSSASTFTLNPADPPPPVNNPPTDIALAPATVAADAAVGTNVGTLTSVDADSGDTFTYALVSDASGAFALAGDQINVAGVLTEGTATINVSTTDSGGGSFAKDLTITVTAAAAPEEDEE